MKQQKFLPAQDLALFCSQLALLIKSGIPLDDGIETIGQTMSAQGKALIDLLQQEYRSSYSLKTALQAGKVFPEYMVQMVGIGEESGNLEEVLEGLSVYYENQATMLSQVRQAVLYPALSVFAMTLVVGVLTWKVVPIFTEVMTSLGGSVGSMAYIGPVLGQIVLVFLLLVLAAIAAGWLVVKSGKGEKLIGLLCVFPPVKRAFEKFFAARFANVLGMLLAGGYQTEQAVDFLPSILPDNSFRQKAEQLRTRVANGESLADAVSNEHIFPGLYAGMVSVGDKSGSMDSVMHKLSDIYQAEALEELDNLIALIEPLLVGVLSASIGVILFSVMLPLLGIMSAIG